MPNSYPKEFREKMVDLMRSGRSITELTRTFGVSDQTLFRWRRQDRIDHGEIPGLSSDEAAELIAARKRIRQLEKELELTRKASEVFAQENLRPKRSTR